MKNQIFYTKPSITEKEINYVTDAASTAWGSRCYEYINRFENQFKKFTGAKFAIATSSCTGALHMGLSALGVGRGDEVIIADTNWIASVAPITYLGAQPVFVDILADTWCLNPELVEKAITPRTKAIVAVHLYGNLCEMDQLLEIGERHGIPVVEDAAEALGSYWQNHHAGTMGRFGVFSFHGSKTITTGEGGMFITNDSKVYDRMLTLSNHGRSKNQTKQFWPDEIGFKYKMSDVQAAIGCGQIERADELIRRKREIFMYYKEHLGSNSGIQMNPEKKGTINGYWMPTVVFNEALKVTREMVLEKFKHENIDGRVFFHPLSGLSMFAKVPQNTNSYTIPLRAINLPSYHDITTKDLDRVIQSVKDVINEA